MNFKDFFIRIFRSFRENALRLMRLLMQRFPFVLAGLALIGIVFSWVGIVRIKEPQYEQYAAERWGAALTTNFRQVSVIARGQPQQNGAPDLYIDYETSIHIEAVIEIRNSLDNIILSSESTGNHMGRPAEQPFQRTWADAYYSEAKANVRSLMHEEETGKSAEAHVIGVAGSYYLFHPKRILEGSFLSEEILDSQSVVLNEQLAWALFRSNDIQDEKVMIGSREYTIVGVVREPNSKMDRTAGFDRPCAYIYFNELAFLSAPEDHYFDMGMDWGMQTAPSTADSSNLAILCYEAILPDPIDGIAVNDLKTSVPGYSMESNKFYFVDHTGRFQNSKIIKGIFSKKKDISSFSNFYYPPGEISAQLTQQALTRYWVILLLCILLLPISMLAAVLTIRKEGPSRKKKASSDDPFLIETDDAKGIRRV